MTRDGYDALCISCRYCGATDETHAMVSIEGGAWQCVGFVGCFARQIALPFGLWRCHRGHHAPLDWVKTSKRPAHPTNAAQEMLHASGLMTLAKWNGWCPRCGRAVEWSSVKPARLA